MDSTESRTVAARASDFYNLRIEAIPYSGGKICHAEQADERELRVRDNGK